jgi:ubiquinone/menaquinone biosynthesis C-methylase UbiE
MGIIRNNMFRLLVYLRLYPHIFFTCNCFKIHEFYKLLKGIEFTGDETILDLGCGRGLQTLLLGKRCKKVVGVDISEKSIIDAKSKLLYLQTINCKFMCTKLEDAQFDNESFDKAFSFCVIEHISNYYEVLREAYRILKKNGQMIFSVDALETIDDERIREIHRKRGRVERYFQKQELKIF